MLCFQRGETNRSQLQEVAPRHVEVLLMEFA
jgi:hypothetical protein